ncbi:HAMP domain-containing sensor histidine kinase [Modestobacter sp. VKM Ac-2986]|uniref:sensor histidine kinase n=1 Tax=Modestobacter sp. VKM Ac-2986 TaxID=3004140 RepID=UPI0022AA6D17|nr:HAMP domain-containing sensor histidine kinase [Modestobacter sp. VKM Ac-2986]MCZ2828871.1 HAMP domain-containing sensor histidine kinase [Modestobacter sp. VKM Ac-2986]
MSLRTKLLLALLVPLALILVLVGFVATASQRQQLISQVDAQLSATADRASRADRPPLDGQTPPEWGTPTDPGPPPDDDDRPDFLYAPGQGEGTLGVRIETSGDTVAGVIGDQGQLRELTDAQVELVTSVPRDSRPRTVDLGTDLGDYRVAATTGPVGDVLVSGRPLAEADTALGRLITVELGAGLAGLAVAGLIGWLTIGRTLRPLQRVAATATRVAELPLASGEVRLAERVPPADTDVHTEVGQVGSALNRMLDHVESSLAARQSSETQVRQFVADASHELRTPLASIRGYAELVRRKHTDVPPEVGHALGRVESEALRMSGLVDDLLLLARLDAGRDVPAGEVDLTALLVDTVSDAHAAGPQHHWRFDLPDGAVVVPGDEPRLHQVIANLLANTRTHTPPGTTATARLSVVDEQAVLQVVDDGPGIPPGLLGHVFERFARGDASRSRVAGSTGLGLAIVHAVVAAHGGTVTATSRPGETTFTVRLPHAVLTGPGPETVEEGSDLETAALSATPPAHDDHDQPLRR